MANRTNSPHLYLFAIEKFLPNTRKRELHYELSGVLSLLVTSKSENVFHRFHGVSDRVFYKSP